VPSTVLPHNLVMTSCSVQDIIPKVEIDLLGGEVVVFIGLLVNLWHTVCLNN